MNVASLELCRELYELSGWEPKGIDIKYYAERDKRGEQIPAYDLGYLLRKLPNLKDIDFRIEQNGFSEEGQDWVAYGWDYQRWEHDQEEDFARRWWNNDSSPEDAAAKLAIELFKQGILTREGN